jgi:hypothetical protein
MKRTVSFYFIDYYYRPLTGAHWDKRYVFLVNTCAFFGPLHRINVHWPQLSANIFFASAAQSSSCCGMISDEGSGGTIVMVFVGGEDGM